MKPSLVANDIVASSTGECTINLRTGEGSHHEATRRVHKRMLMSVAVFPVAKAHGTVINCTFEGLGVLFEMASDELS